MNLDDLRKIAENAHDHIGDICTGKSRWTMTVPVREDDSDILFSKLADGVEELLDRVEKAEQELGRYARRLERTENEFNRLETSHSILEQALQRVRELHEPGNIIDVWGKSNSQDDDFQVCVECSDVDNWWVEYPCPTIRALEGDE